jgi:hypothetical protein
MNSYLYIKVLLLILLTVSCCSPGSEVKIIDITKGWAAIDDPVLKYFPEFPDRVVTEVHEDGTYEIRFSLARPINFLKNNKECS